MLSSAFPLKGRSSQEWRIDYTKQRPQVIHGEPALFGEVIDPGDSSSPIIKLRLLNIVTVGICVDTDVAFFNPYQRRFIIHFLHLLACQQPQLFVETPIVLRR